MLFQNRLLGFTLLLASLFMGGCSGTKVFTSNYMDEYIKVNPVTVFPQPNTDDIAKSPHISYQRLKADYRVSTSPPNYNSYDQIHTKERREQFFNGQSSYFYVVTPYKNEGLHERYRKYEFQFENSSYIDVAVEIESNKRLPLYRVIITPARNITQQELDSFPNNGVVSIDRWHKKGEPAFKLKFKYPKDKRRVDGQFVSNWNFCPECLTHVNTDLSTLQGLAELDRKAEQLYPLSETSTVYRHSYSRQKDQRLKIIALRFKSDKNTGTEDEINKFITSESVLSQNLLLKRLDALSNQKDKAIAANAEYDTFIEQAYLPLTAESYINNLECGNYSEGNINNPSKDSRYLAENKRYMRCVTKSLDKYDIEGYKQFYLQLKETEEKLWASTLGTERVFINTPERQLRAFKKRVNNVENASTVIKRRMRIIADKNSKAEREKRIWTNAFNRAMNNIKQDQTRINNNRLVVDSNHIVMTVAEKKKQQIQRIKTQAYLDKLNKNRDDKKDNTSKSTQKQNHKDEHKSGLKSSSKEKEKENPPVESNKNTNDINKNPVKGLEQEQLEQERIQNKKLEKEKLEKEKLEKREREKREREKIVLNIALTWQNSAGKWFACGPVQCTWAAENSEKAALGYVINEENHSIQETTRYYKCKQYTLSSMVKNTAGDYSEKRTKSRSKCLDNE